MSAVETSPLIQELGPYSSLSMILQKIHSKPFSFFLDSAGGIFQGARYSFLGLNPFLVFSCYGREIIVSRNGHRENFTGDPFTFLRKLLLQYKIKRREHGPPFLGGAVGYLGYDLGRLLEKIPTNSLQDITMPDCCFGFYSSVIIVDHHLEKVWIASSGFPEQSGSLQQKKAHEEIESCLELLASNKSEHNNEVLANNGQSPIRLQANFTRNSYLKAIVKAKEYIAAGDIYQVNLSQRFSCPAFMPPFNLYLRLHSVNPAPFSCFFNVGDHHILSSSPERFLRMSGQMVETRPIKGTKPRGTTKAEDERLKNELLSSTKDRAELIMIVDLERNDLGRVCRFGSIHPAKLLTLETYPTVHHLVSTLQGELLDGYDHIDCLRACFPGGSITGAPKIRSMEIIEELEPSRRKIYTGSIGYLGFNKESDFNIAIRTILHINEHYYFQVGGGIVADSDPELEYEETLHKGKGLMQALGGYPVQND